MHETPIRKLFALAAALIATGCLLATLPALADDEVLARVNGTEVTEAEILELISGELLKLDQQRHEMINNAVNGRVQELLAEAEAKRRGVTVDELFEAEVEAKADDILPAEVQAFYAARQNQIRQPLERVEPQIRRVLAYQQFISSLEGGAEIEFFTQPFRIVMNVDGPSKGKADAPVTIVEFGDFECPPCGRAYPVLKKVREAYPEDVRIVFRQYPLEMHANARKAAEASLCARDQGKFWEMHDKMFENQDDLSVAALKTLATEIDGIDVAAFNTCLDEDRHADAVERDFKEGSRFGVSGTPAFFVNGRMISGVPTFETLAEMIDEELAKRRPKSGSESDAAGR